VDFPFAYLARQAVFYLLILSPFYLSQRYWFRGAWWLIRRARPGATQRMLQALWVAALVTVVAVFVSWFGGPSRRAIPHNWSAIAHLNMWLLGALAAYLAVKFVSGAEWLWTRLGGMQRRPAAGESPLNASRRHFFQTVSVLAGATPVAAVLYGYLAGRLELRVERVEVPIPNLPGSLDGLGIVQLSDIHIGGYMNREQVRRAVEMANELGAELAVVTGDFITRAYDPLMACIEELAALRAPLGVWGCLGNHEMYAQVEKLTAELFRTAGMRILRQENAEITWRGRAINLIGVDYQRARADDRPSPMLASVEKLVRRDVPNVLLSHNPNVFPRAGELGIELTLAGHTHGGQVTLEILDQRLTPVRFVTDYIAGLYQRPVSGFLRAAASEQPTPTPAPGKAHLYVNRGLGTLGMPVRIGAPPEITLLTLRRA
jgi:predicted MPP superfamily phosphohydrolase